MIGYRVTMSDLADRTIDGAARYAVEDDGGLVFTTDGQQVAAIEPGSWVEVHETEPRLVKEWPPADLDYLMENLAELLGVGWGYTGAPAKASDVASEVYNNEEALLRAAFAAVDAPLDEDKELRRRAEKLVRQWFRGRR